MILIQPDGRTREARLLRSMRKALIEQLGGADRLLPTQRVLIERAVTLQLRCSMLDQRIIDGTFTGYDNNSYIAFCNALRRTMQALGPETPVTASAPQSLADYIASKATAA
jgi:hypothetical protein